MLGWLLIGGGTALALWHKHENPHWTPFSTLFATPRELNAALERVRITSVPTPTDTSALDPGMSSQHVKSVNVTLTSETDPSKIISQAQNAKALGFANTSKALEAKANAVGEAKAKGATETDLHQQQLAAQTAQAPTAAVTHAAGWDGFGIEHHRGYEFAPHHHHDEGGQGQGFGGQDFGGQGVAPEFMPWMFGMSQQQPQHHHHHHHEFMTQGHGGSGHGFGGHGFGGFGGGDFADVDPFDPYAFDPFAFATQGHGGGGHGGGGHGFGGGGFGGVDFGDVEPIDPYAFYPPPPYDMMLAAQGGF